MILDFIFKQKKCTHSHFSPDIDFGYCPDCGALIENAWFITRCSCCNIKLRTTVINGKIVPDERYCKNCGTEEFYIEKLNKINFIDINYAVLLKIEHNEVGKNFTQSWVDPQTSSNRFQRLPLFR